MSVDRLQERIRKMKNPTVLDLNANLEQLPTHILAEETDYLHAYARFCMELMEALNAVIPAVRMSFSFFSTFGTEGLTILSKLLDKAAKLGYYVILDCPEALNPQQARMQAETFLSENCVWRADGLVLCSYMGTDGIKPYATELSDGKKSLFIVLRTANKSAAELQDLLAGNRLAHIAQADLVNRIAEPYIGRSGYCRTGIVGAATSGDGLRGLREKYRHLFLLIDGYDYPGANAKNCSYAFDRLGHGAAVCAGPAISAAWIQEQADSKDYLQCALRGCERVKKNISKYICVL